MKIDRITYSESHEQFSDFGLKLWRKVGLEAELQEGDTPEKALIELKQKVNEMLHPITSQLSSNGHEQIPEQQVEKTPKEQAIDSQIEAISGCTSLKSLEIFKKLLDRENVQRLTDAYYDKLNFLR